MEGVLSRPFPSRSSWNSGPQFKVNGKIRAREVRVIGIDGQQLGILPLSDAIRQAQALGVDLVEIAAAANPPVCRIVDFGKFKYEQAKHDKDKKQSAASKMKEIKFRVNIDQHDYETKLRHAEEFLDHGNKVKLRLKFRGREMAHTEMGFDVMKKALAELETMGHPDAEPKLNGKQINVMLTPLPANKRKPKFHVREHPPEQAPHPSAPAE